MATKQVTSESTTAENGNGSTAPEKRELTQQEHLQKANKAMRKAWKMIYESHQKNQEEQAPNV